MTERTKGTTISESPLRSMELNEGFKIKYHHRLALEGKLVSKITDKDDFHKLVMINEVSQEDFSPRPQFM